jgi:hypothetical protein
MARRVAKALNHRDACRMHDPVVPLKESGRESRENRLSAFLSPPFPSG